MPRVARLALGLDADSADALARACPTVESALLDGVDGLDLGPCPGDAAGAALLRAVAASHGPAPVTGAALAAQAAGEAPLPTGIEGLDSLLGGGLRRGWLTELCGASGTGKTQACMAAAALTAVRGGRVVFLYSGAPPPAARLAALAAAAAGEAARRCGPAPPAAAAALARVTCAPVGGLRELVAALDVAGRQPCDLIVIDSLASAAAPDLGPRSGAGRALLVLAARAARGAAGALRAAALVTNGATGGAPPRPALGEAWAPQAQARLLLTGGGGGARVAEVAAGPGAGSVGAWHVPGE